jgi:type IV fimbrial biogenesis protein FimT
MNTTTQRGFTLYELMVTVLVAGVIFGLGVPNLLEFSRNNRMTSVANDFVTAITRARSSAITQRLPVTLCASPNPVDPAPTCSPDASGTAGGYVVWVDDDGDAAVDAGEEIILQREDPQDIVVIANNGYISFNNTGYLNDIAGLGLSARLLLLCDDRGNTVASGSLSAARAIRIAPTGRPTVIREVSLIGAIGLACHSVRKFLAVPYIRSLGYQWMARIKLELQNDHLMHARNR